MIRAQLVEHRQRNDSGEIAGTITLVYDHHKPHLQASLTDIQHDHHDAILSTVHVHLDHHNCLEVLIVRGKASVIRKIARRTHRGQRREARQAYCDDDGKRSAVVK